MKCIMMENADFFEEEEKHVSATVAHNEINIFHEKFIVNVGC